MPEWKDIHSDKKLKSIFAKLDNIPIDESLIDEMQGYYLAMMEDHSIRGHRLPSGMNGKKDLEKLSDIFANNQANRDRVSYIRVGLQVIDTELDIIESAAMRHLQRNFSDELAGLKTVDQRTNMINSILAPIQRARASHQKVSKVASLVDDNLKNTHFTLVQIQGLALSVIDNRNV